MFAIDTFVQCPSTLAGSSTARNTSITTGCASNTSLANFPRIDPRALADSDANADSDAGRELKWGVAPFLRSGVGPATSSTKSDLKTHSCSWENTFKVSKHILSETILVLGV